MLCVKSLTNEPDAPREKYRIVDAAEVGWPFLKLFCRCHAASIRTLTGCEEFAGSQYADITSSPTAVREPCFPSETRCPEVVTCDDVATTVLNPKIMLI